MMVVCEEEAIGRVERPATVASLVADLRSLGVAPGMTVMVHSSLSRLGYVSGGAQAVVQTMLEAVGSDGTIMMPTHSSDLSDPALWSNPPVPAAWWDTLHQEMPAFDIRLTPTRGMGAIVECFRHVPGVRRSAHPTVSAAAVGPNASALVDGHRHHKPACMTSTVTFCCWTGRVGAADARLMRARDIVGFATSWMTTHRTWPLPASQNELRN